ncbi:MAG: flippase-like domain-containing protein [Bacteroidia bacterium]|nr:flippase-like domain-containing protein [Bacteroidia bacterium]
MESANKSKIASFLLKVFIVGLSFYFIYRQIFYKQELEEIKKGFSELFSDHFDFLSLGITLGLMLVNWGIEAEKWRMLVTKYEQISFWVAYEAIFTGVTISIFTPNRIGEYAGRIFHLENADLIKASLASVIGSIAQLLATIIFGTIGLLYIYPVYFQSFTIITPLKYFILALLVIVGLFLLVVVFINSYIFTTIISKIHFLGKLKKYGKIFSYYTKGELGLLLSLSSIRYLIFSIQYYILLRTFNVDLPLFDGLLMVFSVFLVLSIIPSISIAELGIRGSVAIFFFGMISGNKLGIITASFGLWLINLVLPAIIGSLFVFNLKFIRKNKHYLDE